MFIKNIVGIKKRILLLGIVLENEKLWKILGSISDRVISIEDKVSEIARLEERVSNQQATMERAISQIDNQEERLRISERWQATLGNREGIEKLFNELKSEIDRVKLKVDVIGKAQAISHGQKDVGKEALKWVSGILASILVFFILKISGK